MTGPNKETFALLWPKCFVIFIAVIELISVIIFFMTELGNIGANFWRASVFAGGWCGLVILAHLIMVMMAGCSSDPKAAYRAVIVSVVGLVATAALISFDATFLSRPSTCILSPSCSSNAGSNTTFDYNFRLSFYSTFNSWSAFKSYSETNAKLLFQSIQVGIGALCFVTCIVYLILYYLTVKQATPKVEPSPQSRRQQPQQAYYVPQQHPVYSGTPPIHNIPPPLPPPPPPPAPPAPAGYYPTAPQQQYYQGPPPPSLPQPYYQGPPPPPPPPPQPYYQPAPPQQYLQVAVPTWRPPPQNQPGVAPWTNINQY